MCTLHIDLCTQNYTPYRYNNYHVLTLPCSFLSAGATVPLHFPGLIAETLKPGELGLELWAALVVVWKLILPRNVETVEKLRSGRTSRGSETKFKSYSQHHCQHFKPCHQTSIYQYFTTKADGDSQFSVRGNCHYPIYQFFARALEGPQQELAQILDSGNWG